MLRSSLTMMVTLDESTLKEFSLRLNVICSYVLSNKKMWSPAPQHQRLCDKVDQLLKEPIELVMEERSIKIIESDSKILTDVMQQNSLESDKNQDKKRPFRFMPSPRRRK
jgi:hypothetical protein